MPYLKFISDVNLIAAVDNVIAVVERATKLADEKLHSNVVDPFSALFQAATYSLAYDDWVKLEKARQIQKSMQNEIGDFHQQILGAVFGWEDLGCGGGLDVINRSKKILAEIKNKHNTTKGNHKVELYDALKTMLDENEYNGYVGYYVEVIPQGRKKYNKPFVPSDNKAKRKRRTINKMIRIIDGVSFYSLATDREQALKELFDILPRVIMENHEYRLAGTEAEKYSKLFKMAFSTE
ncbi:MAG: Eco47II family restriction endonuclease [Patescibacteria group bacterium]